MSHQISKKYSSSDFGGNPSIDEKILIFEDRVLGWHLGIAELIRTHMEAKEQQGTDWNHAGFVLMNILFTYFEMVSQYESGQSSDGRSKVAFGEGIESVFPGKFSVAEKNEIYSRIRCGMYHSGFVKQGVLIDGSYATAVEVSPDAAKNVLVKVNPHMLSPLLHQHFLRLVADLKDPLNTVKRQKFEAVYG